MVSRLTDVEHGVMVGRLSGEVSMAATPPSSSQIFCATQSLVGFCSLV